MQRTAGEKPAVLCIWRNLSDGILIRCKDEINQAGGAGRIDQRDIDAHAEMIILSGVLAEQRHFVRVVFKPVIVHRVQSYHAFD